MDPLTSSADESSEAVSRLAVIAFIRRGVTHEKCFAAMTERVPDAVAPTPMAAAMHCMHISGS